MKKYGLAIVGLLAITNAVADITESTTIVKKENPVFSLVLKSNPATGYSWFLAEEDPMIQAVKREYIAPEKIMPGAPGQERWFFKVKPEAFSVPRVVKVRMLYARPWDLSDASSKAFDIITTK